jgi:hypothetical protein
MADGAEEPLHYCLRIMNDTSVDALRRDRMAQILMPYFYVSRNRAGKKEDAEAKAKKAMQDSRFSIPRIPLDKFSIA